MGELIHVPPAPGTPEWAQKLSASKVPAVLGISPWTSQRALWHQMRGEVEPEQIDPHLDRFGHMAELMLGPWWEETGDVRILGSRDVTYTDARDWIATLDWEGTDQDGPCIIECKTTRSLDDWADEDGNPAVPPHYEAQVRFQMGVSGIHRAYVVVLGPFHQVEEYVIEHDEEMWQAIVSRCVEWMDSLDGEAPDLDDTVSTYRALRRLHPDIDKGEEVEIGEELAVKILDAKHLLESAEQHMRAYQIVALDLMGRAQKLTCNGEKIADRRNGAHGVNLVINRKATL
ncbi:YqaJ viral recombinase family protein [Corynebacterium sanguinis]|uniref:YqaJ viral recombinase family protein n=1 Tax=Corynebacterium sanguinis TaxID=2594913 RepID=UPI0021A6D111|nr:YqaJ viral recombinase family protein [Corynebacterium sanguinis]MCT1491329.1 YqaJ viral recombinase family protein [Corynebacterium sanguinis]MCT2246752.1 YqaJ viral recombinase family protein [Corynebacterium sanguinis]